MNEATAVAHPNIALSKYWGKRAGEGNYPAVPSLSVTLRGMATTTRVRFGAPKDRFVLGGRELDDARVFALLERVRRRARSSERAEVISDNDFPTASGLASSASGFAALALAASRAAGLDMDAAQVSELARESSASAARSLFGGYVELDAIARPVAPVDQLDLTVLVCVTSEGQKDTSSSEGMKRTAQSSPYYQAWLEEAPRLHARLKDALLARDLDEVGRLAEGSALAMHASAIAAGVVYWNGATLAALSAVRALRASGVSAYATIDAGPHVKVLLPGPDAKASSEVLSRVPGVLRVLEALPGEGARIVS
jgi:diphosphomevalonate decarboxylase